MRDVPMSANEPLPPDHSRKPGITCGAGFANTMRYPKRRRGLKYVKRIAIQTTQTVMLVITATFRLVRFRKINAPRIVRRTTTFASPSLSGLPLILLALVVFKRQRKIKCASLAMLAFQPHAPAMLENDLVG